MLSLVGRRGANVQVLGPLAVLIDGRDVTPTAPKERQVLALMAMRPGTLVSAADFITELWDQSPPRTATGTLQTYVQRIRRAIARSGAELSEPIVTETTGYTLAIDPSCVDLTAAEEIAAAGHDALRAGDAATAAARLRRASSMWRGAPLANITPGPILESCIRGLDDLAFTTMCRRIEADLRQCRHGEVVPELAELVRRHRFDEGLWEMYLRALNGCGRRRDALVAFIEYRRISRDELGLEPSDMLCATHESIITGAAL